jgi:hypothetical protein
MEEKIRTATRGAAGVTPAPGVYSADPAQNPEDGILLSGFLEGFFENMRCCDGDEVCGADQSVGWRRVAT